MALKKKKKAVKKAVRKKAHARKKAAKRKAVARKAPVKKVIRAKRLKAKAKEKAPKEDILGTITHYFPHVRAAVIKLNKPLMVGESIRIKGHTTDFTQAITSMQVDHVTITEAKKGQEIGLLVESRVRQHDKVFKA